LKDSILTIDISSKVENDFRERYILYLRSMKQRIYETYREFDELEDERKLVYQQAMRTPGRRGEIIKKEEIDKEFSRRHSDYIKHHE
jgi:hypothetical protein